MPSKRHVIALGEEVQVVAEFSLGKVWDRYLSEALEAYLRFERQGLSVDEIARELELFLSQLSRKPIEEIGRRSTAVIYNEGRDAELRTMRDSGAARYVVRSEILDTNTCENCEALDGEVFEIGTVEYDLNMPPAECLGGERCRGFYVALPG